MGLHQRLLFEGTNMEKYCAMCMAEFCISAFLVAGLASVCIRHVDLLVEYANLSGKAQRAAATEAGRARV